MKSPTLSGSANDARHSAIHPQQCVLLQKCRMVPETFFAHHGQTLAYPRVHSAINDDSLTAASPGKDAGGEASPHAVATNDVQRLSRRTLPVLKHLGCGKL